MNTSPVSGGGSNTPNAATRKTKNRGCLIAAVLMLLAGGMMTCLIGFVMSFVVGEEFSPDTFQRRFFSYNQIPILRIQVTPIFREERTTGLEEYLVKNNYVRKNNPTAPRWDLVFDSQLARSSEKCDARILMNYLDQHDSSYNQYWLEWTTDHPELAKVLWPAVAEIARRELYLFLPELFHIAMHAGSSEELQERIAASLHEQYVEFGLTEQKLGNHLQAAIYLKAAQSYNPDDADTQSALDESLQHLTPAELKSVNGEDTPTVEPAESTAVRP